jgi:hypothetical protein
MLAGLHCIQEQVEFETPIAFMKSPTKLGFRYGISYKLVYDLGL